MKKLFQRDSAVGGSPRTYSVRTGAGTFTVEDDGRPRWAPGTPIPRDRQPDALLALARHAEAHERHLQEEGGRGQREGRRAA